MKKKNFREAINKYCSLKFLGIHSKLGNVGIISSMKFRRSGSVRYPFPLESYREI